MAIESYFGLTSIILTILGIISFIIGLSLKKKILWIIGLIVVLICGSFLLWMFSMN